MSSTAINNETVDIVLPLIILIIFIVVFGWLAFLIINSGFQTTSPENPVASDQRKTVTITCPPGQCATNLLSGFKTCPVDPNQSVNTIPSNAVCNSRFSCENPLTPYAVLSNGGTTITGQCEPGTECQCLATQRCPNYITSVFTTSNGNPFQNLNGQRITFPQKSTSINNTNGTVTDNTPIQIDSTSFCTAPISWLPLSNPGCNFVNAEEINYQSLLLCMGSSSTNNCNTLPNPCLQGVLAFLTDNPDTLNQRNIATTQVGCVRGVNTCNCNQVPIFDTSFGGIVCRSLPP